MKVVYFQRATGQGFSIERLFSDVRAGLPPSITSAVWMPPCAGARPDMVLRNLVAVRGKDGDVNHVTGDAYYLALGLKKSRTVLSLMDCVALTYLNSWKRYVARKIWFEWPVRRAQCTTVISRSTAGELQKHIGISADHFRVIPCPLSPCFVPVEARPFRPTPLILQVGTVRTKNLERLAAALYGLNVQLRVVGGLSVCQRQALAQCRIRYEAQTGLSSNQLLAEYANCDLVVFASTYEGFGLPIIEAQAVGRPIVTSNVFSMPEVAGDAACLVDPLDPQSIRDGILKVINDRSYRESLVVRGFKNVKRFEASHIARQYHDLYCEILAGQR